MQGSKAALRYAKAVLSMAKDQNSAKEVNKDMTLLKDTIGTNAELSGFLKSPVVKNSVKKSALLEIFKNVHGITAGLFDVLIDNNRADILAQVASKYKGLYDEMNQVQVAKVTTAVPLSPELEKKIQNKVKELTGNEAKIQNIIDEAIIGGFILRVGDIQYNGSIQGQFNDLKREFKNNAYVSKI